jgi:predicted nucleic acid-binding protein
VTQPDTKRVVIADVGPLIALARVEALYLLRDLFGRVCITTTIRNELLPAEAT